ncbi:MAG: B12-binding domain-containing radical SAM protein [Mucinivorans sp.]
MKTLLITPPLTGLNTPYPATTVLKGHLESVGLPTVQWDMSIATAKVVFSSAFLARMFSSVELNEHFTSSQIETYLARDRYIHSVDSVWRFLSGADATLAQRIAYQDFLPRGARFDLYQDQDIDAAFGAAATADRAKHFATLYLEDLTDFIRETIDEDFDMVRYGEQIALSLPTIDPLLNRLTKSTIISDLMIELLDEQMARHKPDFVGLSVPFPGCLLAALRVGQHLKNHYPATTVALGGGYVNTELRTMSDSRLFRYVDYVLYDDGQIPLQRIIQGGPLVRTALLDKESHKVVFVNMEAREPFVSDSDFSDIDPTQYISTLEMANPMHRLWNDGFWNKITAAHGCYWAKCAFCDTKLDYIGRYDPLAASAIVDTMQSVMAQTSSSGFHFTDEALPPKLMSQIADEIIARSLTVSYWGNIRFEKSFTAELCRKLARSGCIAVSGGLEVASPEILLTINKGVTIEGARTAMENLTSNAIMVHTYLMYGFPGQTLEQTIDSLDIVRSMFSQGLIQSAFWHRFTLTLHSPIGGCPSRYGAQITGSTANSFANNGVDFQDGHTYDLDMVGQALSRATYNYMHGLGLEKAAKKWFKIAK